MKKIILRLFVIVFTMFFMSCSKDKSSLNAKGYWFGMSGIGTGNQINPIGILFREDGTLRVYTNFADTATGNKAEGTYSVSGNSVTTTFTYFSGTTGTYSSIATTDVDDDETLNGTYGIGSAQSGEGTFWLSKQ